MNAVKRYIRSKGYAVTEPEAGWEMLRGKYPLSCGAMWYEGHHVDSERCILFRYLNMMGWEAVVFERDGSNHTEYEDFPGFPGLHPGEEITEENYVSIFS